MGVFFIFLEFIFKNKLAYYFVVFVLFEPVFKLLIYYHPLYKRKFVIVAKVKEEKNLCLVMKDILDAERK